MARFASLILSLFVLAGAARAQTAEDPRLKPVLKAADLKKLNNLSVKWIAADLKYQEDDGSKNRSKFYKARDRFKIELKKKSKTIDALASVGNMLAIFRGVFPYKRMTTSGEIKRAKGGGTYHILEPKPYKHTEPYPSVLVLPGWDEAKNKWIESKAYIAQSWKKSTLAKSVFTIVPDLRTGDDYDKPSDLSTDKGNIDETERIKGIFFVFGEVQRKYHLDRERMFLDCGVGTAGFGMRLATYFPSRFAGVILRRPVDLGDMQLQSLTGLPVLLVSSAETSATVKKIEKALNELQPNMVTVVEGAATDAAVGVAIDAWIKSTKRRLFPLEVNIAPNHDSFHRAFWANIITCEPLDTVKKDERPQLKVKADHKENQITVTSRGVSEVWIFLNDYLVDLDKEVTFVINGKKMEGHLFQRSIKTLKDHMHDAYDPTALYTALHKLEIPKEAQGK